MNDVTVTGVEDGALVLESRTGERFRLVIDDVLQSHVRRARTHHAPGPRVSPRDIQAHLRAGLSPADVAELTGATLETIERFEGPVSAELAHTVASALSVAVVSADDVSPDGDATFGSAIRHRIETLGASDERWSSWKDPEEGWLVKLTFTASGISNDARWAFDPKRHALTPANEQATLLSRPGGGPRTLVPRLRAVETSAEPEAFAPDAFVPEEPVAAPVQPRLPKAARAAINRDEHGNDHDHDHDQTADLLEALRRRRGERESAPQSSDDEHVQPARIADHSEKERSEQTRSLQSRSEQAEPRSSQNTGQSARPRPAKKGRAALPSWDEIVFGAKPDDD